MEDYLVHAEACSNAEGKPQVRAFAGTTRNLVEEARDRHHTSPTVTAALGRLLTAGAIIGSQMKNDTDVLTMQIRGDGPVHGLTVAADNRGHVKGFAANPLADAPVIRKGHFNVAGVIGNGTLTVIRDLGMREPYAGTVRLTSGEIAEDIAYYYAVSEQVPSAVALGVLLNQDDGSVRDAGGFLIQMMPFAEEETVSRIEENLAKLPHVTELLRRGDSPEQMLEEALAGFDVTFTNNMPAAFRCECSKERFAKGLVGLGAAELQSMLDENKDQTVNCSYCGRSYVYTPEDLKDLLEAAKKRKQR